MKIYFSLLLLQALLQATGSITPDSLSTRVSVFDTLGHAYILTNGVLGINGPDVGPSGVLGRLVVAGTDLFACDSDLTTITTSLDTLILSADGVRPIVLIERSPPGDQRCSFEQKVLAVQSAGAAAAIIFDYKADGPTIMNYAHNDVTIPAVFISNFAGQTLISAAIRGMSPLVLLAPEPANNSSAISGFQFGMISFTTGILILLIAIFPVVVIEIVSTYRHRRKLEDIISTVYASENGREAFTASLPDDFELPKRHGTAGTISSKLHNFFSLVFVLYVFLMSLNLQSLPSFEDTNYTHALCNGLCVFAHSTVISVTVMGSGLGLSALWDCASTSFERVRARQVSGVRNQKMNASCVMLQDSTIKIQLLHAAPPVTNIHLDENEATWTAI